MGCAGTTKIKPLAVPQPPVPGMPTSYKWKLQVFLALHKNNANPCPSPLWKGLKDWHYPRNSGTCKGGRQRLKEETRGVQDYQLEMVGGAMPDGELLYRKSEELHFRFCAHFPAATNTTLIQDCEVVVWVLTILRCGVELLFLPTIKMLPEESSMK